MVYERYGRFISVFIFPDFGEENTPLEEQGLCAAKFILRCTQHTLLFAHKGHHPIPKNSGYKPDLYQAFFECRNKIKNRYESSLTFHAAKL